MNTTIKTLSTVAALGADCSISNGFVYVTGLEPMLQKGIYANSSVVAPVTEVLQVSDGLITKANSTFYGLSITYTNKRTGILESITMEYTSSSTATAVGNDEILNYFIGAINGMSEILPITASTTVANTITLTAVTGQYSSQAAFSVASYGVGTIAFPAIPTTPPVIGVGKGIFLKNGNFYSADLVDDSYYYQAIIDYANGEETGSAMNASNLIDRNVLYVLSTATNVLSLVGTYGTLTQAIVGVQAIWTAAGTVPTLSNGVITLGGADIFYGNSDTNIGLVAGDVINIVRTTAIAYNLNYRIASILSGTTAATANIPNDLPAAATNAWYIKLTTL